MKFLKPILIVGATAFVAAQAAYLALLAAGWPAIGEADSTRWLLSYFLWKVGFDQLSLQVGAASAQIRLTLSSSPAVYGGLAIGVWLFIFVALTFALAMLARRFLPQSHWRQAPQAAPDPAICIGRGRWDPRLEARHLLAVGSIGAGKSQVIRAAVRAAASRGQPGLVVDPGGELASRLYDPECDCLIAPRDARSVGWSPLAEMEDEGDADLVAAALIPRVGGGGESAEWNGYAQTLCAGILHGLYRTGGGTNAELIRLVAVAEPSELEDLLAGHPASGLLRPGSERMFASIASVASSRLRALRGLTPDAGADGWSVRRWVRDAAAGRSGWLFVPIIPRFAESSQPLASIVNALAVSEVLGLPENERRRFWIFCDELGQLPAIDALPRALTLGRKYGLSVVAAVQSISQLRETYGQDGAQTLLSVFSTKAIFRAGDGETAEWCSREIGDTQIVRTVRSSSHNSGGKDGVGSSSQSTSEQHSIERLVLASEVQALPDLACYFLRPAHPALRTPMRYVDLGQQVVDSFVPRRGAALEMPAPAAPVPDGEGQAAATPPLGADSLPAPTAQGSAPAAPEPPREGEIPAAPESHTSATDAADLPAPSAREADDVDYFAPPDSNVSPAREQDAGESRRATRLDYLLGGETDGEQ